MQTDDLVANVAGKARETVRQIGFAVNIFPNRRRQRQ
jgi:hypothetical protein